MRIDHNTVRFLEYTAQHFEVSIEELLNYLLTVPSRNRTRLMKSSLIALNLADLSKFWPISRKKERFITYKPDIANLTLDELTVNDETICILTPTVSESIKKLRIESTRTHFFDLRSFTNLTSFRLYADQIESLLLPESGLEELILDSRHQNSKIDLKKNYSLRTLSLSAIGFQELDLTAFECLTNLLIDGPINLILRKNDTLTDLTIAEPLDLKSCLNSLPRLSFLKIHGKIPSIEFPENQDIQILIASRCQIESVDLMNLRKLKWLDLFDNKISELDLTENLSLEHIEIENNPLQRAIVLPAQAIRFKELRRFANLTWRQKRIAKTFDLHRRVELHNWDEGIKKLKKIIRNKYCDAATAAMIYWDGNPEEFQIYTDRDSVPAETKDLYLLLREIEDRMHAGYYKRQFISFKHSPLDELHDSEIETPPHPIPEIMKKDYTPQFPQ